MARSMHHYYLCTVGMKDRQLVCDEVFYFIDFHGSATEFNDNC
jgi:hypothetical protein